MKKLLSAAILLILTCGLHAGGWNNPSEELLRKSVSGIVFPRIDFDKASGVEILEFIRSRIWDTNFFEQEGARPAFEYRCSPDRLLKDITFKTTDVSCSDALSEVCARLGVAWAIEKGKIVFTDSDSNQESEPGTGQPATRPELELELELELEGGEKPQPESEGLSR